MKNFFKKSALIVTVTVLLGGFFIFGTGCWFGWGDGKEEGKEVVSENIEETPVPSPTEEPDVIATVTPTPSCTPGEKKKGVYTEGVYKSEEFGYSVDIPKGFRLEVFDPWGGCGYKKNEAIFYDKDGDEFMGIYTPPLEVGLETYEEKSKETIDVPGSDVNLNYKLLVPTKEAGSDAENLILVDWGEVSGSNEDFFKAGWILMRYKKGEEYKLDILDTMLKSFRFS